MIEAALKVTWIFGAAALMGALLRHRSAALRHAIWLAAMVAALVVPLLPQPAPSVAISVAAPVAVAAVEAVDASPAPVPKPWIRWIWALGAAVTAARFLAGLARVARLSHRAIPFAMEDGVPVRISTHAPIPFTWGVWRPVILLPSDAASWSGERLALVLRHERVHVRRRDWLAQSISQAACCVYWFHPLAWYAARRMRAERERACDDELLRSGVNAVNYAGHLLDLTRAAAGRPAPGVAMAEQNELEARMRFLLDLKRNRKALGRAGAIGVIAAGLVVLAPLTLIKVRAQVGGGLRGVVQDPSGARVPEATLVLKKANGQEVAYSGADGAFLFPSVPAGDYTLQVLRPGFARFEVPVTVAGGSTGSLDVTLPMGRLQENLEIVGARARPPAAMTTGAPQRIRVGGHVQPSRLIVQEKPVYPQELQDQGIEGTVVLDAVIGVDGSVLAPRSANTSVHPSLVKAASDAVSRWRYEPTLLNGQPVEIVTSITVRFRLPAK